MSDVKLVKVDNWGIYFLQRLKHFFNRTDYCDLTLQFQDNAQLKVHRLVLSACTEYFELLERTCEMYEDCLVMPDDLQADVVVPIVNFMYTGQLEFKMDLLDRLYQTSEIMNMPVLTKLLNSHRPPKQKSRVTHSYPVKRATKPVETARVEKEKDPLQPSSSGTKRSYSNAFDKHTVIYKDKKYYESVNKKSMAVTNKGLLYKPPSPIPFDVSFNKKYVIGDPRPTRYELPEELDTDNVFESSFSNISYASQPLIVHPETRKQYSKKSRSFGESSSKGFGTTTVDIVECKKITNSHEDNIFEDTMSESITSETEMFQPFVKIEPIKDSSHLFDQIVDQPSDVAKVTIETAKGKNNSNTANLDHAKIISEVLKKYPHLVKSNKNIKLKILNTPNKTVKKTKVFQTSQVEKISVKNEQEPDFSYETDVLDYKQAAKLIAMGAENIEGPWICLICGTPGRALQFTSYYKYRRHLVENHNEKPVLTICEYCGQRTNKINYMLYHMYTKHNIEPPPQYHFPKCNKCDYIALTEALLVKHKKNHQDSKGLRNYVAFTEALSNKPQPKVTERKTFQCCVCSSSFKTSNQLLAHIQMTGHKFKKPSLQCIYCMKTFLRESNFYAHLKIHHKNESIADGIIDDSDDESNITKVDKPVGRPIKCETPTNDYEEVDVQYQIQQRPDGIHVVTKKQSESPNTKQKILNAGFSTPVEIQKSKTSNFQNELMHEFNVPTSNDNEVIMIDNTEYLLKGNKLVHRNPKQTVSETIIQDAKSNHNQVVPIEFSSNSNIQENVQVTEIVKTTNLGQPISIYVSNEEEYKALMSANHPIIFDADDTNKSLTVLTAPNAENLETTAIDLDTSQTNDMMIIQDGYPLNVSEAVVTENSNIVVVYSHDVDQNKEFQLLSTQALEPQFVQSSAIVTQNYETVTTSTPVMSAHVLETPIEDNWQNATNIHEAINNQSVQNPTETVIQQTTTSNDVAMTNITEQNVDLNELPQVEMVDNKNDESKICSTENITDEVLLPPAAIVPVMSVVESNTTQELAQEENISEIVSNENITSEVTHSTENLSQINDEKNIAEVIASDSVDETVDHHIGMNLPNESLITSMSEEGHVSAEEIVEETLNTESHTDALHCVPTHENNTLINDVVLNENNQEIKEQIILSHSLETIHQEPENVEEIVQENIELVENEQVIMSAPITDENDHEIKEEVNTLGDEINNDVSNPVQEIEKIETLALEWSEDSEATSQDTTIELINKETIPNNESETEESIENIQQEVVKHLNETRSASNINNVMESDSLEDNGSISNVDVKIYQKNNTEDVTKDVDLPLVENSATTTVKITSLLNDWEDNYSQDDDESSINENASADDSTTADSAPVESDKLQNPIDTKDNIKSLVSDWDDDDEDK